MSKEQKLEQVRRKTRLRLSYAAVTLVLYFSFALNWTSVGSVLGKNLGSSAITGSLLMFASLVVVFIGLEILFLRVTRSDDDSA